jgi:hypothetical protein
MCIRRAVEVFGSPGQLFSSNFVQQIALKKSSLLEQYY